MLQNSFIVIFTSKNASIYAYNTVFTTHVTHTYSKNFTARCLKIRPCLCMIISSSSFLLNEQVDSESVSGGYLLPKTSRTRWSRQLRCSRPHCWRWRRRKPWTGSPGAAPSFCLYVPIVNLFSTYSTQSILERWQKHPQSFLQKQSSVTPPPRATAHKEHTRSAAASACTPRTAGPLRHWTTPRHSLNRRRRCCRLHRQVV